MTPCRLRPQPCIEAIVEGEIIVARLTQRLAVDRFDHRQVIALQRAAALMITVRYWYTVSWMPNQRLADVGADDWPFLDTISTHLKRKKCHLTCKSVKKQMTQK